MMANSIGTHVTAVQFLRREFKYSHSACDTIQLTFPPLHPSASRALPPWPEPITSSCWGDVLPIKVLSKLLITTPWRDAFSTWARGGGHLNDRAASGSPSSTVLESPGDFLFYGASSGTNWCASAYSTDQLVLSSRPSHVRLKRSRGRT